MAWLEPPPSGGQEGLEASERERERGSSRLEPTGFETGFKDGSKRFEMVLQHLLSFLPLLCVVSVSSVVVFVAVPLKNVNVSNCT